MYTVGQEEIQGRTNIKLRWFSRVRLKSVTKTQWKKKRIIKEGKMRALLSVMKQNNEAFVRETFTRTNKNPRKKQTNKRLRGYYVRINKKKVPKYGKEGQINSNNNNNKENVKQKSGRPE